MEAMKKAEENWAKIEERLKLKQQGAKEHPVKDWILQKEREKRSKDAKRQCLSCKHNNSL